MVVVVVSVVVVVVVAKTSANCSVVVPIGHGFTTARKDNASFLQQRL
jgi:hypothetical protein